jgi:hypothetical protein
VDPHANFAVNRPQPPAAPAVFCPALGPARACPTLPYNLQASPGVLDHDACFHAALTLSCHGLSLDSGTSFPPTSGGHQGTPAHSQHTRDQTIIGPGRPVHGSLGSRFGLILPSVRSCHK